MQVTQTPVDDQNQNEARDNLSDLSSDSHSQAPPSDSIKRARKPGNGLLWLGLLSAILAGAYYFRDELLGTKHTQVSASTDAAKKEPTPWNGIIELSAQAQESIGLSLTDVVAQTEPILLPILGTSSHDDTKLSKIAPLFKGRVEKVYVSVGDQVAQGQPLVDLYSAELAQAKTNYEIERSQWEYVHRLLEVRTQLRASNAISEQLLLDTQNDELKQRHEYDIALEKLILYGLSDTEITAVEQEKGAQRARLTVRSPANGIVINRNAVTGNIYNESDVMMVVAPNDHLWVWGNVFEYDLAKVHQGQKWDIKFGSRKDRISGTLEYVSPNVDPQSHAVKIRTTIPNPDGLLKADMLVDGYLQIQPEPNYVSIPRLAMIVVDGGCFAFTRLPNEPGKFQRHIVHVVHEREDQVILKDGLAIGEKVVVIGGLILQQLYEENEVLAHGRVARAPSDRD